MAADWLARRQFRKLQEEAIRYAANGWPVVPLALPTPGVCPCGEGCVDPHPYGDVVRNAFLAEAAWANLPGGLVGKVSRWSRRAGESGGAGRGSTGQDGAELDGEELGARG